MITYLCKYTPIEILEAFGTPVKMMEPEVTNFTQADTLLHPNLCSFVKAVLEDFETGAYEGMLFTTCCDSVRRLYDTLKRRYPEKFFFCFDLPRKRDDFAALLYKEQMEQFIEAYTAFSGKTFDAARLAALCADKIAMRERKRAAEEHRLSSSDKATANQSSVPDGTTAGNAVTSRAASSSADLRVCLAGARPGSAVKQLIEEHGAHIALDLTCTGIAREYAIHAADREGILTEYAAALLGQIPCMRMAEVDGRAETLLSEAEGLDGILYHTVKFCDIYSYEYTRMKETIDLPIVKLETDATSQCAGQILTRVEAFLESLRARKTHTADHSSLKKDAEKEAACRTVGESGAAETEEPCCACPDQEAGEARLSMTDVTADQTTAAPIRDIERDIPSTGTAGATQPHQRRSLPHPPDNTGETNADPMPVPSRLTSIHKGDSPMYVLGIDSGSTSTNAVLINEKKEILSYAVLRTGARSIESAERIRAEVLKKAHLTEQDLSLTISTGYGRVSIPFADRNITEISCHARGAHFVNPAVRTILDIGGQDSKAIRLNENGDVIDFVMNDKCAAGTGRFLEMMANTLEIGIADLGPLSLQSTEKVEISSMCSVFAESEVISLIAQNKEPADIARGIHRAIAKKAMSLLKKVGLEEAYMMTGGVAKNPGMVAVLEEMLGAPLYLYDEPEIVGALGAALFGL